MDREIDLAPLKEELVKLLEEKYSLKPVALVLGMKIPAEQFERVSMTEKDSRAGKIILLSLTDADIQCTFTVRSQ